MSGVPQNLDDALRAAVDQEADAVLKFTGGDVYGPGQKRLETPSGEPVKTPETTSGEEKPATEEKPAPATTAEEPKLIAGKYKTEEEAIKGFAEAGNTISSLRKQLDEANARIVSLAPKPAPAPEVVDPLDEVERFGVPKEPLRAAMNAAAQDALNSLLAPMQARAQADMKIITEVPEYKTEFDNLTKWLHENPDVEKQVVLAESIAKNPDEFYLARKYAWMHYDRARASSKEDALIEKAIERKQDVVTKRIDAAIVEKKQTVTRDTPAKKDEEDWNVEKQERLKDLRKSGHEAPLWRAAILPSLAKQNPGLFGPEA